MKAPGCPRIAAVSSLLVPMTVAHLALRSGVLTRYNYRSGEQASPPRNRAFAQASSAPAMPLAVRSSHIYCPLRVRLIAHEHRDALAAMPLHPSALLLLSLHGRARQQYVPIQPTPPGQGATRIQGAVAAREQSAQKWSLEAGLHCQERWSVRAVFARA